MKKSILLCVLFPTLVFSQPAIQWKTAYGGSASDYGNSITQTTDGNYLIAGTTTSNNGDVSGLHGSNEDAWIVKIDASGAVLWQKCLGGSSAERGVSIKATSDGGSILTGFAGSSNGDVSGGNGSNDVWAVKLDSGGTIQWQHPLGGSGFDFGEDVIQASDGLFVIAGSSYSTNGDATANNGGEDGWIVKLDSGGGLIWQKNIGGSAGDSFRSVVEDSDGGFLALGRSSSSNGDISENKGLSDLLIAKVDADGNLLWTKTIGGSGNEYGQSIIAAPNGNFVLTGSTESNNGDIAGNHGASDLLLIEIQSDGTIVWQKCLGGTGNDIGRSISSATGGGFVVCGRSGSANNDVTSSNGSGDFWIIRTDISGNIIWQKSLGGSSADEAMSVLQTADGGYITAGSTASADFDVIGSHGIYDVWVVKFGSDLGYEDFPDAVFSVYPNPVKNQLKFSVPVQEITITDASGRIVKQTNGNLEEIEVSDLSIGTYVIKARISDSITSKIFVKN